MERHNSGFLLVAAIVILVILSVFALVISNLSVTNDRAASQDIRGAQALYIADAGLHEASEGLLSPIVYDAQSASDRESCSAIATNLTNVPVGAGVFAVAGTLYRAGATTAPVTLNGALPAATADASAPPVPFNGSASDYAPAGRIMIGGEAIDYSAISQSSATCATVPAPCFLGVVRGVDGTAAVAHASGTPIAQDQCTVKSQGGVPSVTAPQALRTLTEAFQLQGGWAVGSEETALEGGGLYQYLLQWKSNDWVATPAVSQDSLNAVTCTSYVDCWAVGSADLPALVDGFVNFGIQPVAAALHWNGQTWTSVAVPKAVANHDLDAVACASYDNCWMVGSFTQTGGGRWTLLHWTGAFTRLAPKQVLAAPGSTATLSNNLYDQYDIDGVACVSASRCWAVGSLGLAYAGGRGGFFKRRRSRQLDPTLLLEWNGTQWTLATSELPSAIVQGDDDLDAITCLAQGCWAVGSFSKGKPIAVYWDAATNTWTAASPTQGADLESIACANVNDCWAGGSWSAGQATLDHWNGTQWTDVTPASAASDIDGISCIDADNCWAVGSIFPSQAGELQLLYYDGSTWRNLSADIPYVSGGDGGDEEDLEGIYLMGAHSAPQSAWQEVFP